jgi:trehalose 6-phosphate synthase
MSLIVVSNRVARPQGDEPIAGGLAAALLPAVRTSGAIWFGASGRFLDPGEKENFAKIEALGTGAVASIDLPAEPYRRFYHGFANSALWPVLHSRADLIRVTAEDYAGYCEINAFMARSLLRFSKPDAMLWVHDYHFMTLGAELRRLGVDRPIGFFLHTPFPSRHIVATLPQHRELVGAMLSYDLIGFQTDEDMANFSDYLRLELGLAASDDGLTADQGSPRLACFPIGIDVKAFVERARKASDRPEVTRLRASLNGANLAIGVDRLDYSKGLLNRLHAFDRLLESQPQLKRAVSLLQIAVPSRGQIDAYRELRSEVARLVGEINGRHGEVDWTPIRYLNRGFSQTTLAGLYRAARAGLVTSLHDGMNLVAKEYVAAQNPQDPGVLVLSRFTGAAKQLNAALLINPNYIDGMARAISKALAMSADERIARWKSMMQELETSSLQAWFSDFVAALAACADTRRTLGIRPAAALAFRPRRLALSGVPASH